MEEKKKILLKVKHVDVKFNVRGRTLTAIRDANLEIFDRETLAIVGESGSGKSVLTKTFAGMLDPNGIISHGNVYFYDDEISHTEVKLNFRNNFYRDFLLKALRRFTYASYGHEQYQKILDLNKKIEEARKIPPKKQEEYEKKLKDINDDINDTLNDKFTYVHIRTKEGKQKYSGANAKLKVLYKEQKQTIKDHKVLGRKIKSEYALNSDEKKVHKAELKALEAERDAIIEEAMKNPLSELQEKNAFEIANEIILSVGRYPFYLFYKYVFKLMKAFKVAYSLNKDMSTEKQRRRVFEPIVFRVEYRESVVKEYRKIKNIIDQNLAPQIVKDKLDDPVLENETLIEQARDLHPHLRKQLIRNLKKTALKNGYENENQKISDIVDLILLEAGQHDSTILANITGWRLLNWAKRYYNSKKENASSDYLKSQPKTTLVGYAFIDCAKVRYLKDWEYIRGRRIATVFQDPMTSLDPIIPIGKQIMMVIQKHQKCSTFEAKRRALAMMEKVGITEPKKRFDDYPFQYSGGMRQRIVIAIALSCQPKILICDEPTTALDVTIQAQIIRLIKKLSQDLGFTTVYITHDLGVVANVADRVAVLYAGQIVELGTVEDIFYDPYHPYTWALLSSMPQLGQKGEELFSIPGTPPSLYSKIVGDAFAPRSEYALAIDYVKEPPMFEINEHHFAKTWLLDPRAPKISKPEKIQDLHMKMVKIYGDGEIK